MATSQSRVDGGEADVAGDGGEGGMAATVDHDRDLWAEQLVQAARVDAGADGGGERARIGAFRQIEASQRGDLDRHAGADCDAHGVHLARQEGGEASVKPLIWKLPRAVTSTMPLPCAEARLQSPIRVDGGKPSCSGLSRTSRPSPVRIGTDRAGQAPRRENSMTGREMAAGEGAFMPPAPGIAPRR